MDMHRFRAEIKPLVGGGGGAAAAASRISWVRRGGGKLQLQQSGTVVKIKKTQGAFTNWMIPLFHYIKKTSFSDPQRVLKV